jgi:hypothetical protein
MHCRRYLPSLTLILPPSLALSFVCFFLSCFFCVCFFPLGALSRTITDSDAPDNSTNLFSLLPGDFGGFVTLTFTIFGAAATLSKAGTITAGSFSGTFTQVITLTLPARGQTKTFIFTVRRGGKHGAKGRDGQGRKEGRDERRLTKVSASLCCVFFFPFSRR